jgi:hypothetical protein
MAPITIFSEAFWLSKRPRNALAAPARFVDQLCIDFCTIVHQLLSILHRLVMESKRPQERFLYLCSEAGSENGSRNDPSRGLLALQTPPGPPGFAGTAFQFRPVRSGRPPSSGRCAPAGNFLDVFHVQDENHDF